MARLKRAKNTRRIASVHYEEFAVGDVFDCHWDSGYVDGPKRERKTQAHFIEDNGYTDDDRYEIGNLEEGEDYVTGGPIETLTITSVGYRA